MRTIFRLIAIFSIFWSYQSHSQQAPNIQWQNTIGGNQEEFLTFIEHTSDLGYIVSGISNSNISGDKNDNSKGGYDYWVVKLDSIGNIMWQKTIGGSANDSLRMVRETNDGGYICAGYSSSNISGDKTENSKGNFDYWVVKLDINGNIQWQKTLGGNRDDRVENVEQTTDGGYILGGWSESDISGDKSEPNLGIVDFWVVKIDSVGNLQWENTIGGSSWDHLDGHIIQTVDGGYICGGQSVSDVSGDKTENSRGHWDYWIVKLNVFGSIEWQKTIGGNLQDWVRTIHQTPDKGFIVGGTSFSDFSGEKTEIRYGVNDYWVMKLDSVGNIEWQNTIGGGNYDYLMSINMTSDGGYFAGGRSNSNASVDKTEDSRGDYDYWVMKLDAIGNIEWQKTLGGDQVDWINTVEQVTDGGFIVAGYSASNMSGDKTENNIGLNDLWIIKLEPEITSISEIPSPSFSISPNPSKGQVQINFSSSNTVKAELISVYSLDGKKVQEVTVQNQLQETLNLETRSSGTYLVQVSFEDSSTWSKKIQMID